MFLAKPLGILPPYMDTGKMLTIYNNQVAKSQFGSLLQAIARLDSRPRKGLFLSMGKTPARKEGSHGRRGEGCQEGTHVQRQAGDREGPEQGRQGIADSQVHRAGPQGGGGGGQAQLDRRPARDAGCAHPQHLPRAAMCEVRGLCGTMCRAQLSPAARRWRRRRRRRRRRVTADPSRRFPR